MSLVETWSEKDISVIILNRPDKLNAFNSELLDQLNKAVEEAKNFRGLVISGEGRAFSAGDDIYEMYSINSVDESMRFFNKLINLIRRLIWFPGPVVAAVNGFAVGGGAELLLLTDYNIAYRDVWLWYPEYRIGVYPPVLLALGPLIMGLKRTKRIAFGLVKLGAEEAYDLGIIDEVISRENNIIELGIKKALELSSIGMDAYKTSRKILAMHYEETLLKVLGELYKAILKPNTKRLMKRFIEGEL